MEKYRVSLADEERAVLESLVSKGKAAARRTAHARILLLADKGHDDEDSASALEISARTVCRVRKRLVTEGFLAAVDHKPQPPRPDKVKIKANVEQQRIRVAYSDPPRGIATGPCNCWPTRWSPSACSRRAAPKPSARL